MSNVLTYQVSDLHGSKDNVFDPGMRSRKHSLFENFRDNIR